MYKSNKMYVLFCSVLVRVSSKGLRHKAIYKVFESRANYPNTLLTQVNANFLAKKGLVIHSGSGLAEFSFNFKNSG